MVGARCFKNTQHIFLFIQFLFHLLQCSLHWPTCIFMFVSFTGFHLIHLNNYLVHCSTIMFVSLRYFMYLH